MTKQIKNNSAFSLIEVLIFVSILTVFFVVAAAVAAASLRNLQLSQHKILATRYMEEVSEWLKTEKEVDFETFSTAKLGSGSGPATFCYNTYSADGNSLTSVAGACAANDYSLGIPAIFKREVTFTKPSASVPDIKVDIVVSWKEVGLIQSVGSSTIFGILE